MTIYLGQALLPGSSGSIAPTREYEHVGATLQQAGFTSSSGHPDGLNALTVLFSPLPFD